MDKVLIIIIAAIIVEATWETLKMTWQNGKFSVDRIGSLAVGSGVAILAKIDLLKLVGLEIAMPIVGMILTGILISRGSNFVHELLGKIETKG